jgi:hypothetical protein
MEQDLAQTELPADAGMLLAPALAGKLPASNGLGWLARIGRDREQDGNPGKFGASNGRGSSGRNEQDPEQDEEAGVLSMMTPAMPPIAPPLPPPIPMPFPARIPNPKPSPSESEPLKMMLPQEPGQPKVEILTKAEPVKGISAFQLQMKAPAEEKSKRPALPTPMPSRMSAEIPATAPVFSQPTPPQAEAPSDPTPVQPVGETRRADAVENAAPPTPPAHHIALRVKADDDRSVDIRLVSRAGEVHVSVHTPDQALARTMRTELGSLTGKLAEAGFGVHGVAAGPGESSSTTTDRQDSRRENSDSHQQQQQQREQQEAQQQQQHGRGRRRAPFLFDLELN